MKAVRRAKLFVFLREHRHELFDERLQAELAEAYVDSTKGQPPVPPARLALATIVQAYTGGASQLSPPGLACRHSTGRRPAQPVRRTGFAGNTD